MRLARVAPWTGSRISGWLSDSETVGPRACRGPFGVSDFTDEAPPRSPRTVLKN
jgi:hypothetical protein